MTQRRLALMGSGETTPTMVTPHQRLLALVPPDQPAVVLETPYGFQENAEELTARTRHYFAHRVGREVHPAGLLHADAGDALAREQALELVRAAGWVYSGPGSPTYAMRQWLATPVPDLLRAKLTEGGGVVVLSSAAAATAGRRTVPVYEVYKVGEDPAWRDGLDLTGALDLQAVVIPHFDNAEGGTHDTRYCYLGERRLRILEDQLDPATWVLGIDEHTCVVVDPASGRVDVSGRGGLHVRARDVTVSFPADTTTTVEDLVSAAQGRAGSGPSPAGTAGTAAEDHPAGGEEARPATLLEDVQRLAAGFDRAMAAGDGAAATAAALEMESLVRAWSADPDQTDVADRAVAALRSAITRLGDAAAAGMHDHGEIVRPHIETLVHVREEARRARDFAVADHIRRHMAAEGVELKDTPEGTDWEWEAP